MTRPKANPKPPGRRSAFSGEKLEFLETYKDEWLRLHDHQGLYTLVVKRFFLRFGYDLPLDKNPAEGTPTPNTDIDPSLPIEDRIAETKRRDVLTKKLRKVK